jgi:hypothetical protein
MTQTINRIYQRREDAEAATLELKKVGFADDLINVVAPAVASHEHLVERIRQGGVASSHAEAYAERIEQGATLVSVQAAFGLAATVTGILDKHSPSDTGLPEQGYDRPPPDPATPLSSACGWKVLINNPTPLSSYLGWRVLSTNKSADNPAPFSTRLGLPVLSKEQKPPPQRFGMPLLSADPAPFSALLGLKLLSNDPAPLSRLLGLRVLSDASPKQSIPKREKA